MKKKAIILDLDNTIYPVSSIGEELFRPVFELIEKNGEHNEKLDQIKKDIMRKPFQKVALEYGFREELTKKGINLLEETTWDSEIEPFEDYKELQQFQGEKFLVTTGFTKMQRSKLMQLKIPKDFEELHIVDPEWTLKTKKDVFKDIMERHGYKPEEILVIGDDPDSEIRGARELGIQGVLYDKMDFHPHLKDIPRIKDFGEIGAFIG